MGHFKSISRKQRHIKRLIYIIVILFLIILFAIFCKEHWQIKSSHLQRIMSLYLQLDLTKENRNYLVFKESSNINNYPRKNSYESDEPIVYIYNTHQSEKYAHNKESEYNIDYDVLFASQILASYLDEFHIYAIVEMNSINDILKKNEYTYAQSYKVSRQLLEKAKGKYPSLKYYIDLHRDSSEYDETTCIINEKKYARFLFVVGLEHDNYEKNEAVVSLLNEKIKEQNNCLSRGIMRKSGTGVNGIYNQDFDQNVLLVEVGGQYNGIEEVNNSLAILAKVLANYIKEYV